MYILFSNVAYMLPNTYIYSHHYTETIICVSMFSPSSIYGIYFSFSAKAFIQAVLLMSVFEQRLSFQML